MDKADEAETRCKYATGKWGRGRLVVRSWPGKCKVAKSYFACLASAPMYSEGLHCAMGAKCLKENHMRVLSRRTLPGVKSNLCNVIYSLFRLPGGFSVVTRTSGDRN